MPRVGFEPMNPVLERTKTARALDRAAIVIGPHNLCSEIYLPVLRGQGPLSIDLDCSGKMEGLLLILCKILLALRFQ
jgi:hypothetical protein